MLQQTQVSRVIPKYREFLRRFPTSSALARAKLRDVLQSWSGLGYNRRARNLWQCARELEEAHDGKMPRDSATLQTLPGVGRYTAGAVASFAFGAKEAVVDTNVRRVLSRALLGVERANEREVWQVATDVLPGDASSWNHALMDIGALFCRAKPLCSACPVRTTCEFGRSDRSERHTAKPSNQPDRYEGSRRQQRGRVIRALIAAPSMSLLRLGPQVKEGFGKSDLPWLHELLGELVLDGLVALNRTRTRVALP